MAKFFGLYGVAIAHSGRLILDNILMSYFAQKNSKEMNLDFIKNSKIIFMLTLTSIPAFLSISIIIKLIWWTFLAIAYLIYVYKNFKELNTLFQK